jgi:hypothetical protein
MLKDVYYLNGSQKFCIGSGAFYSADLSSILFLEGHDPALRASFPSLYTAKGKIHLGGRPQ